MTSELVCQRRARKDPKFLLRFGAIKLKARPHLKKIKNTLQAAGSYFRSCRESAGLSTEDLNDSRGFDEVVAGVIRVPPPRTTVGPVWLAGEGYADRNDLISALPEMAVNCHPVRKTTSVGPRIPKANTIWRLRLPQASLPFGLQTGVPKEARKVSQNFSLIWFRYQLQTRFVYGASEKTNFLLPQARRRFTS